MADNSEVVYRLYMTDPCFHRLVDDLVLVCQRHEHLERFYLEHLKDPCKSDPKEAPHGQA